VFCFFNLFPDYALIVGSDAGCDFCSVQVGAVFSRC
jgi:hypothetical protein